MEKTPNLSNTAKVVALSALMTAAVDADAQYHHHEIYVPNAHIIRYEPRPTNYSNSNTAAYPGSQQHRETYTGGVNHSAEDVAGFKRALLSGQDVLVTRLHGGDVIHDKIHRHQVHPGDNLSTIGGVSESTAIDLVYQLLTDPNHYGVSDQHVNLIRIKSSSSDVSDKVIMFWFNHTDQKWHVKKTNNKANFDTVSDMKTNAFFFDVPSMDI